MYIVFFSLSIFVISLYYYSIYKEIIKINRNFKDNYELSPCFNRSIMVQHSITELGRYWVENGGERGEVEEASLVRQERSQRKHFRTF